jgi:hypothetical protein
MDRPSGSCFFVWLGGCATSVDLRKTQRDYDSKMSGQQGDVEKLQARSETRCQSERQDRLPADRKKFSRANQAKAARPKLSELK